MYIKSLMYSKILELTLFLPVNTGSYPKFGRKDFQDKVIF